MKNMILAGSKPVYIQVGMALYQHRYLKSRHDWWIVEEIVRVGNLPLQAVLRARIGGHMQILCSELRANWRLSKDFDPEVLGSARRPENRRRVRSDVPHGNRA